MTLAEESFTQVTENYILEIIKRMADCMSVCNVCDRISRKAKSPLEEQVKSDLNVIEVKRSIFNKHAQLMQWINITCKKTVEKYLDIALTNSCNYPLRSNVKVILK